MDKSLVTGVLELFPSFCCYHFFEVNDCRERTAFRPSNTKGTSDSPCRHPPAKCWAQSYEFMVLGIFPLGMAASYFILFSFFFSFLQLRFGWQAMESYRPAHLRLSAISLANSGARRRCFSAESCLHVSPVLPHKQTKLA